MTTSRVTLFQQRVYEAVMQIPRGRVSTYGLVAASIGCASARAVGQALRRNPFAPKVPCHRVIASSLASGGFRGECAGPEVLRKLTMLGREGVRFSGGKLADPERVFRFRARPARGARRRR